MSLCHLNILLNFPEFCCENETLSWFFRFFILYIMQSTTHILGIAIKAYICLIFKIPRKWFKYEMFYYFVFISLTLLSFCHEHVPRLSITLHVNKASWPGFTSVYFGCSANLWKQLISRRKKRRGKSFLKKIIKKKVEKGKKIIVWENFKALSNLKTEILLKYLCEKNIFFELQKNFFRTKFLYIFRKFLKRKVVLFNAQFH